MSLTLSAFVETAAAKIEKSCPAGESAVGTVIMWRRQRWGKFGDKKRGESKDSVEVHQPIIFCVHGSFLKVYLP
jgi:hypothetical protein